MKSRNIRSILSHSPSRLLLAALILTSTQRIHAQEIAASPSIETPSVAASSVAAPSVAADQSVVAVASSLKPKKNQPYTGPTTLVELPPTPMLDEEGAQRQDPDGHPMFNPPLKQQRDKQGHPLFADGKPVFQTRSNLGYDENGKKVHASKEKPPKVVSAAISRGTLTVDGMTGKAALNYDIKDLKYIYFYVPGIGITVVSNQPFPGAVEQKHAFDDKTLTVNVNDHTLQVSSDKRILGKAPESAFVRVDKNFIVPTRFPVMGYGPIRVAPYAWPGSRENAELKGAVEPPPLPENLRPAQLLQPCPVGQMRAAAGPALPGQPAPQRPCVAITKTETAKTTQTQSVGNTQSQQ
jgi:hypothetical protein